MLQRSGTGELVAGCAVLVLSTGAVIDVFSDTLVDPWTFVTLGMTYVGTPGDERDNGSG